MNDQVQFQRYRLSVISTWPESALKRAAIASARAALEQELAHDQLQRRANRT